VITNVPIQYLSRECKHVRVRHTQMVMRANPEWSERSDPEISIGVDLGGHTEDVKGSIIGERFGKYLLIGEIAAGGMAEVFLAVHQGMEGFIKAVVIKRVLPHLASNPEFMRMFVDEARLEARLEHPNIVRTYEFGEVGGQYFTAMEYLPGEDLSKVLKTLAVSKQVMPVHITTGIVSQLCTGLHFAHQFTDVDGRPLNLVHRDVNPANIIITFGGEVKIIDFGVAKSTASVETLTGTIKGKIAYMPPEQLLGRDVDHRADIFSAGVVLWEMLTGKRLFWRNTDAATLYAIMNDPIPPPSTLRSDIPLELDRIVARAVARAPADRFDTAEQMACALDDFMAHTPRFEARLLGARMEELFGSTRAEAKRSIAQTRSLTRNISSVMKLRSQVRADLAERLDATVLSQDSTTKHGSRRRHPAVNQLTLAAEGSELPVAATGHPRLHRGLLSVLTIAMLACIAAGLAYTTSRSDDKRGARPTQSAIRIESTPPGAAIFAAGEPTGLQTPTTLTGITGKQLSVRLELANYAPSAKVIEVAAGETVSARMTLTPLEGRVVLSGLPPNAIAFLDDQEYAAGEVIAVTAGTHMVRVVLGGRTLVEQAIDTATGDQGWRLAADKLVRH
jgi:serine/threonine protein kinase